ncbi:hypothetical protein ACMFMG_005245 [Clarireedia jacksonii]
MSSHLPSILGQDIQVLPYKNRLLGGHWNFELGSLIAALSPNSIALIFGRTIQGIGGAGVTGGVYTILAFITRPKYLHAVFGVTSAVWSLSSVLGPILSGVFTQYVSWRWCLWVNLPIGGAAAIILLLFLTMPAHSRVAHTTLREIPFLFHLPGMTILISGMVCLLLVLENSGVNKAWDSGYSIGLLVAFFVILILLVVNEWKQGERAMVVPRLIKRRSILALALFNLTAQGSGFARVYNLPIFFQAAQGTSPSESGIRTLPTVLTTSIFSFVGSILIGKVGYYQLFLIVSGMFVTVGSGMIYTLEPNSSAGQYIGYQVSAAIGSGLVIQLNFVGGTIGVSAATNIMNNVIIKSLPTNNPNISPANVLAAGATGLRHVFPDPHDLAIVVNAYMRGLKAAWIWSIALSGLAFLIAFGAEWKSVKPADVKERYEKKAAAVAAASSNA